MITKIQNVSMGTINSRQGIKTIKKDINIQSALSSDIFQRNISFKGKALQSGEYDKDIIEFAKSKLNEKNNNWKETVYQEMYEKLKTNRPRQTLEYRNGKADLDMNSPLQRAAYDMVTLGIGEVFLQLENHDFRNEARDYVKKIEILIADLQNMKLKESVAEMQKREKSAEYKVNYLRQIDEVKENQLKPKLLDLVQRAREGRPTDMPNCIMLSNKNDKINEELINWVAENVNGKFVSIKNGDGIVTHLEEAEDNYKETGDWTIMYVKDMDKLIDHNQVENDMVEYMKDIMSAAAEDYHTTIIFSSTHPETLDKIALQPHRVKKIKTEDIKTPEELSLEDVKDRLKDSNNAKNVPLSTINDLLTVLGSDDSFKLSWNPTYGDLKSVDEEIKEKLSRVEDKNYEEVYNLACEYIV